MGERVMSKQPQITVDPNQLLQQAQLLRERLASLQLNLAQLEQLRVNIRRAKETLSSTNSEEPLLFPSDPDMNALVATQIIEKDKAIVRLGGNVYAKLSVEKAIEVLDRKEEAVAKTIDMVQKEYSETAKQLEAIETILQQIAMALEAGQAQMGQQKVQQG
jgi:prefoldin alpha subunit